MSRHLKNFKSNIITTLILIYVIDLKKVIYNTRGTLDRRPRHSNVQHAKSPPPPYHVRIMKAQKSAYSKLYSKLSCNLVYFSLKVFILCQL
jgi:hypothetical protein